MREGRNLCHNWICRMVWQSCDHARVTIIILDLESAVTCMAGFIQYINNNPYSIYRVVTYCTVYMPLPCLYNWFHRHSFHIMVSTHAWPIVLLLAEHVEYSISPCTIECCLPPILIYMFCMTHISRGVENYDRCDLEQRTTKHRNSSRDASSPSRARCTCRS